MKYILLSRKSTFDGKPQKTVCFLDKIISIDEFDERQGTHKTGKKIVSVTFDNNEEIIIFDTLDEIIQQINHYERIT